MAVKYAFCPVSIAPVRAEASDRSEIVTQLLFGEVIEVHSITEPWASISTYFDAYSGFIDHKHLRFLSDKEIKRWLDGISLLEDRERILMTPWGKQRICRGAYVTGGNDTFKIGNFEFHLNPAEEVVPETIVDFAKDYLNTPYLWGGKSPYGIDCSGIVQIIYRIFGFNLPRDASEQVLHGEEVEWNERRGGDLAYFTNSQGKVTHVGILSSENQIIHASGWVREDILTSTGIIHSERNEKTHDLYQIRRMI